MYQFSGKLKTFALALMALGIIGIAIGFITSPSSIEEVKEELHKQIMHMDAHDGNCSCNNHGEEAHHEKSSHSSDKTHVEESAYDAHAEHLYHQLKNRPWAAIYVALFFFVGSHFWYWLLMQFNELHKQDGPSFCLE